MSRTAMQVEAFDLRDNWYKENTTIVFVVVSCIITAIHSSHPIKIE